MKKIARERITMEDVARIAGVAKITVSRALQDSPLVRQEVRDRVKEVARKQGYRLNTTARNLRLQRTHSITAVIENDGAGDRPIGEPLVQMVVGGMLGKLAQARYQLVLTTRTMFEATGAADADGIVLAGQGANDEATRRIKAFGLPTVVWGTPVEPDDSVVFVGSDNHEGGRLVGQHLLDLGRKKILFLGDVSHPEISMRAAGLRAALGRKAKLTVMPCAFTQSAGRTAMLNALAKSGDIDGVAAASDRIALGAMDALRHSGKRIPQDVAVVGYDDAAGEQGLTSIRQEWILAGETLATKLLQVIHGEPAKSEQLPVKLIVRASSQP